MLTTRLAFCQGMHELRIHGALATAAEHGVSISFPEKLSEQNLGLYFFLNNLGQCIMRQTNACVCDDVKVPIVSIAPGQVDNYALHCCAGRR